MARKVRVFFENTPQHIIIETLTDIDLTVDEEDYDFFYSKLLELSIKHSVDIHAYIVTKSFFEFLATPKTSESISKLMQSLGKSYVTYYNKKYNRTGTIWQGRYKSSLIEPTLYLFDTMKYIESHDTEYSSKRYNQFFKTDRLVTPHELYKELAFTDKNRAKQYKRYTQDRSKQEFIKYSLQKQTITASKYFIKELEDKLGESLTPKKRGRPQSKQQTKGNTMYKNLVILDKEKHKDLKVNPLQNLNFAKDLKFIPTLAQETINIAANFPVVFSADQNSTLMTLVSLGADNLAINSEGKWITQYVPSALRKYPFQLASTKENKDNKVILIDEDSDIFSTSTGNPLFDNDAKQSQTLENAIKFLTSHEQQMTITNNITKIIAQSGILEDREIAVGEGDDKKILVNGFKVVDKEKLNKLSDDILAKWVRDGIITFIDAHLKSLENIQQLFNIAHQRQN